MKCNNCGAIKDTAECSYCGNSSKLNSVQYIESIEGSTELDEGQS